MINLFYWCELSEQNDPPNFAIKFWMELNKVLSLMGLEVLHPCDTSD
jgi:hypothetical protein